MQRILVLLLLLNAPLTVSFAQSKPEAHPSSTQASAPPPTSTPPSLKPAVTFGLQDGTPVKLRIARTLSSADAKVGETVDFEVLEDVKVGEAVFIPRGGIAWATVTEAMPKRRMGRGGKLNVNIDSVRLTSGEKIALRAVKDMQGGGHVGAMTGAIVATSIVFFPAAPFFLFMKGKDITIPKGTEIAAYVNGDVALDPAKFASASANKGAAVGSVTAPSKGGSEAELSSVVIQSDPAGSEVWINEKFLGNTPSTLRLSSGDHTILIKKAGFATWQRTITLNAGSTITVEATLTKTQ